MRIIRYLASTSFDFGCTSFDYVAVASLLRLGGRLLPGSFVKAVELFLELCERCFLPHPQLRPGTPRTLFFLVLPIKKHRARSFLLTQRMIAAEGECIV